MLLIKAVAERRFGAEREGKVNKREREREPEIQSTRASAQTDTTASVPESPGRRDRPQLCTKNVIIKPGKAIIWQPYFKTDSHTTQCNFGGSHRHGLDNGVLDGDGMSARQAVVHNVFNSGFST
jgi:hypothetical protein